LAVSSPLFASRVFDEVSSTDGDPDLLNHTAHSTALRRLSIEVCYQGLCIYAFMQERKRALHALSPSMNASTRCFKARWKEQIQSSISFDEMLQRQRCRAKRETRRQPIAERSTPPRRRFVEKHQCARVVKSSLARRRWYLNNWPLPQRIKTNAFPPRRRHPTILGQRCCPSILRDKP
jgi:hypothetical protein